MEKKIVCYDIDGTLTTEMLFVPLIESEYKRGILKNDGYAYLTKTFKEYKAGRLDYENAVESLLKIHAKSLKGVDFKIAVDNAREFIRENAKLFRPFAKPLIEKQRGNSLQFAVTAEPQYVADAVSEHLGLNGAYASVYELSGDKFTGKLSTSLAYSEDKSELLSHYTVHAAFGDSAGDVDMLKVARHSFCVDPDDKLLHVANERGWHVIDGELKDVDGVLVNLAR